MGNQILSVAEVCYMAFNAGYTDSVIMLTDNDTVASFPRIVDVSFCYGRVQISMKTCIMVDPYAPACRAPFSSECLTVRELFAYVCQFNHQTKPLCLCDSSGLAYMVTPEALSIRGGRLLIDISVCVAREI